MAECRSRSRGRYPTRRYNKKYSSISGGSGGGHLDHNHYYLSNQTSNNYVYQYHHHHSVHSHHHNHKHSHHHYHHHFHRDRDRDREGGINRERPRDRSRERQHGNRQQSHRQIKERAKHRDRDGEPRRWEQKKDKDFSTNSSGHDNGDEDDNETTDDLEGTVDLDRVHSIYKQRYAIGKPLGQGTFGSVVECIDNKRKIRVAVKIVRSVKRYLDAAEIEVDILNKLDGLDVARNSLIIRLYKSFRCDINGGEHSCLVFEKCGLSLYDYIKKNKYRGFPLSVCAAVAYQLLHSIAFCHAHKLTHTDLKLENVLFVADECVYDEQLALYLPRHTVEIRLIDFGGATFESDHHSSVINTRQYRCPEVILGLEWNAQSDIWSIGCILAELYSGELLFATHSDAEHLALIQKILDCGQFPAQMITPANVHLFESRHPAAAAEINDKYVEKCRKLSQLIEDKLLCSLIRECLQIDPNKRITAHQAKKHPFFQHFVASPHIKHEYAHFNAIYNLIHHH